MIKVGTSTAPDFPGSPLEMLAASHGRIRTQCATLLRLSSHVATFGSDDAARVVTRYALL
jgi:hypothetical protein